MTTILDYGSGNISAIVNAYDRLGKPCVVASSRSEVESAARIILPGVGSFDHCMEQLHNSGLKEVLDSKVTEEKVPVLGICIGLHMMATSSEEGAWPGLGWIDGNVRKFDESELKNFPKIPHMGWNSIKVKSAPDLFDGVDQEVGFYFMHSYYIALSRDDLIMTTTSYGQEFVSGICSSNIYAVQFHPEKSHRNGLKVFKNFSRI